MNRLIVTLCAALLWSSAAHGGILALKGKIGSAATTPTLAAQGAGWSGNTAVPAAQGNSGDYGYGLQAIARWDTVPWQTVGPGQTLHIGVIAFHQATVAEQAAGLSSPVVGSNIAKVSVSVDGGAWVDNTTASVNADEGVYEYNFDAVASTFSDGLHEARAIIYPTTGTPQVLQGPSRVNILAGTSISGTTLTVSNSVIGVPLLTGMTVGGPGVANSTIITAACTTGASNTTCPISPSQGPIGPVDMRAGETPGLLFTTNNGGSLSAAVRYVGAAGVDGTSCGTSSAAPCLTIGRAIANIKTAQAGNDVGGGTVCVQAGTFAWQNNSFVNFTAANRWLNVTATGHGPCDSVGAGPVFLNNLNNDTGIDRVHHAYVNYIGTATGGGIQSTGNTGTYLPSLWIDHSAYVGASMMTSVLANINVHTGGIFCTESSVTIAVDGCYGALLDRNMTESYMASDAFQLSHMVVNSTVTNNTPSIGVGDTVLGSPIVRNFTGAARVGVNDQVYNTANLADTSAVQSVDSATQITLDKPAIGTATGVTIAAGPNEAGHFHPDVWQHAGNSYNWIGYGITANDPSNGKAQGMFPNGSATNFALVNTKWLNNTGGYVMQVGDVPQANWLWSGNNWDGLMLFNGNTTYAGILIYRDTCSVAASHPSGITVTQSPSC